MKCKHEHTVGWMWRERRWSYAFLQPGDVTHHHRVTCDDCHAWLSLGPAADDSEQVRVEVRAAELAAEWNAGEGSASVTSAEALGWSGWPYRQPREGDISEWAGFGAAQILNHDREQYGHVFAGSHNADYDTHAADSAEEEGR